MKQKATNAVNQVSVWAAPSPKKARPQVSASCSRTTVWVQSNRCWYKWWREVSFTKSSASGATWMPKVYTWPVRLRSQVFPARWKLIVPFCSLKFEEHRWVQHRGWGFSCTYDTTNNTRHCQRVKALSLGPNLGQPEIQHSQTWRLPYAGS